MFKVISGNDYKGTHTGNNQLLEHGMATEPQTTLDFLDAAAQKERAAKLTFADYQMLASGEKEDTPLDERLASLAIELDEAEVGIAQAISLSLNDGMLHDDLLVYRIGYALKILTNIASKSGLSLEKIARKSLEG